MKLRIAKKILPNFDFMALIQGIREQVFCIKSRVDFIFSQLQEFVFAVRFDYVIEIMSECFDTLNDEDDQQEDFSHLSL